jgi:hypothetical protein
MNRAVKYIKILILCISFLGFMHLTTCNQLDNCIITLNINRIIVSFDDFGEFAGWQRYIDLEKR